MPRLVHVNGPPGIGKSTLAQLYVDDHPGVLNLDIDHVRCLIGGWREAFSETGALARPIALNMATTHLRAGHDVVMPQYLGRVEEIERFEAAAHGSGATFCEVALLDERKRAVERFFRRGDGQQAPWHEYVRLLVEREGGTALLEDMYDRLSEVLRARSSYVVVQSAPGGIRETYEAFVAAIDGPRA